MALSVHVRPSRIDPRRTLGPLVAMWIEDMLCHGPGDVQGRPIELDDEQVRFLAAAYAIDDAGRRVVRRAGYIRPKGRAKSELAAMIACAEALGPVRFADWGPKGYPRARPVTTPIVVCAATEEGQADNTYGAVHVMLTEGEVSDTPGLDVGITRTFLPGGGKIHSISARASSKDGGKETFINLDETHLWISPELHNLAATLRRNAAKRREAEPWSLETSTMYAPGQGSVAEHSHRFAQAITSGETSDPGFLWDYACGPAPEEFDWDDDAQLRRALQAAYGDAAQWMDMERLIAEARDPATTRADFIRYFLNRPYRDQRARWVKSEQWDALADPTAEIPAGTEVVCAVDVGIRNDSTALVTAWLMPDGRELHELYVWSARSDTAAHEHVPGGRVRLRAVTDRIREIAERHDVLAVAHDPRFFEGPAQDLDAEGFNVVEIVQSSGEMRDAEHAWFVAVTSEQTIVHNGDPVFAAHVADTVATKTDRGWKLRKMKSEEGGVAAKIDGTVASIMARAVLRQMATTNEAFVLT